MARMGEIIDGKYEVLREIGRGGMSVVYLAMDRRLNKQWAIKEFRKDKDDANKQVALKALLDEANLMKKFDHPTLPRIVDIIEETSTVYVVMDYIEGESLNKVLDAYGAQPQEAVIEWAKQLSEVLDYLHTQNPPVIYRDMKPANIMLKPDGSVRLIDFGIAREWKEGKAGDTEAIGTRGYAAPEQFGGRGQTDARTDIYSLGVTLYHLVTGKNPAEPPYEIYPIRHWDPSLSSGLEWMIQKCTQLNPNDRYQSCAEITYVLENLNKFESEYKKKLKGKLNIFILSASLTLVFALSATGCFVGANTISKNTYQSYMDQKNIDGYVKAIEQDKNRPDAYVELAGYIRNKVESIQSGETADRANGEISDGDIVEWFTNDRLNGLKERSPEEYAEVCYEIGRKYWISYVASGEANSQKEAMKQAAVYFEKVLTVGESGEAGENAGLGEQKYTLAQMYYQLAYFVETDMSRMDDGEHEVRDPIAEKFIYGVEDGKLDNPYYSFWMVNRNLVDMMMSDDREISELIRVETLQKIIYTLKENQHNFYAKTKEKDESVTGDDFKQIIEDAKSIIEGITDSEYDEDKEDLKKRLNELITMVNADKNYNIELEAIK